MKIERLFTIYFYKSNYRQQQNIIYANVKFEVRSETAGKVSGIALSLSPSIHRVYYYIYVGGRFTMTTGGGVFGFRRRISRATSRRRRVYKIRDTRGFFFTFPFPPQWLFHTTKLFSSYPICYVAHGHEKLPEKMKKKTRYFYRFYACLLIILIRTHIMTLWYFISE